MLLTEADGGQQTQAVLWGEAGGEEGLQDVVGERQRDHGLIGRVDDQHGDPQTQEPGTKKKGDGGGGGGWGGGRVTNTEACEKQQGVGIKYRVQEHGQVRIKRRKHIQHTYILPCAHSHSKLVILG